MAIFKSYSQAPAVNSHALIVAIGDYPEQGGWAKLSSLNDIPYIKNLLARQDIQPDNIITVTNEKANIEGIRTAIRNLISKVHKWDIVVIHFSCHGELVEPITTTKI